MEKYIWTFLEKKKIKPAVDVAPNKKNHKEKMNVNYNF